MRSFTFTGEPYQFSGWRNPSLQPNNALLNKDYFEYSNNRKNSRIFLLFLVLDRILNSVLAKTKYVIFEKLQYFRDLEG